MHSRSISLGFLFIFLFSLGLLSCSPNRQVEQIAVNFLKALNRQDFESAARYGTEQTRQTLDFMRQLITYAQEDQRQELNDRANSPVRVLRSEVLDESAVVYLGVGNNDEEERVDLVEIDGEWKVEFNKGF